MDNVPSATSTTKSLREPDALLEAVVTAVADVEGTSPLELRPLAGAIDPDALDALFRDYRSTVSVEFDYCGYRVCVSSDDRISVEVYDV